MKSGWPGESQRHSMARKGIITRIKSTPMYHGTKKGKFQYFIPRYSKTEQLGFGIHFTPDKEFAEMYAYDKNTGGSGKKPYVYQVLLDIKNPLIANTFYEEGTIEFDLALKIFGKSLMKSSMSSPYMPGGKRMVYLQNIIDKTNPKQAEQIIREFGYDGVVYNSKLITRNNCQPGYYNLIKESESYIVFDNNQIKIVG